AATFKIDEANNRVVPPQGIPPVISTFDLNAMEAALQLKSELGDTKITTISFGPATVKDSLKQTLALGADEAVHIMDDSLMGGDAFSTAYVLAQAIRKTGDFDLILTGRQASDWDQGLVPIGVAEYLGIPSVNPCRKVEVRDGRAVVERVIEDGYEVVEVPLPAVVTASNEMNTPRYPTLKGIMAAAKKQLPVWMAADLDIDAGRVGEAGSRSTMVKLYVPKYDAQCEFIEGDSPAEQAEKLALKLREARLI
ncbi:MAG TPA: electron transfer flavoprotein subunit beta/FixA family protein, partial [Dehalococcoidia bacterium]|nr:electron transfer flavoprotein subunit beta/FixA family protein [Dehalococcoidia bacterium]